MGQCDESGCEETNTCEKQPALSEKLLKSGQQFVLARCLILAKFKHFVDHSSMVVIGASQWDAQPGTTHRWEVNNGERPVYHSSGFFVGPLLLDVHIHPTLDAIHHYASWELLNLCSQHSCLPPAIGLSVHLPLSL